MLISRLSKSTDTEYIIDEVSKFNTYFNTDIDYRIIMSDMLPKFNGASSDREQAVINCKAWVKVVLTQYSHVDDNSIIYYLEHSSNANYFNNSFIYVNIIDNVKRKMCSDCKYFDTIISKYTSTNRKMPHKEFDSIINRFINHISEDSINKLASITEGEVK